MADYKIIKTNIISQVTEVRLYDETFQHAMEHAELPYFSIHDTNIAKEVITRAISDPAYVTESYNLSFVYVDPTTMNDDGYPLIVPVKVHSGTSAYVKTWFFGTTSGTPKVLYRKSDEE